MLVMGSLKAGAPPCTSDVDDEEAEGGWILSG